MIVLDGNVGARYGRAFLRESAVRPDDIESELAARYIDNDDGERDAMLRELLGAPLVRGTAHPEAGASDIRHVYLYAHGKPARLFACVIASQSALERMLEDEPAVYESFCFQVAPSRRLTAASLTAAIEAWAERNYPDLPLPRFAIDEWLDPLEASDALLAYRLEAQPPMCALETMPDAFEPNAAVATPALEAA